MRLFVALDLTEEIRAALREPIAKLRPLAKSARWARPEGMHVTLKFIGHVDLAKLDAIRAALATARSNAPVEMQIRGVGFFPDERRPRVLWCGIEASTNLAPLAAEIDLKLQHLRNLPADELSLEVDVLEQCRTRDDRAAALLRAALEGDASRRPYWSRAGGSVVP